MDWTLPWWLWCLVGAGLLSAGFAGAWFIQVHMRRYEQQQYQQQLADMRQRWTDTDAVLEAVRRESAVQLEQARDAAHRMQIELATTQAQAEQARLYADQKVAQLEQSEQRLQKEFERLAGRILEHTSEQFEKRNQTSLQTTLAPLRQQLDYFRKQVSEQYNDETKERASLKQELHQLRELNQAMAREANALTQALKGDNKQQGNWGEIVLGRILEQSGLREGHEYSIQSHHRDDDGRGFKPDVIVHLPQQKDVVIDSKVSLVAYERYFNTDDDSIRRQALSEHIQSLRQHIRQLGKKNYQNLDGVRTLDYVLLFIPLEPAFLLAVDRDPELISLALEHNIMLVSPTNLLVALRTVHNIWQYEYQNQNAQRIASDAAKLYDKFAGFVGDMDKVRNSLDSTSRNLDQAYNKLRDGRGNLIGRVEKFRKLGVQPTKRLAADPQLTDDEADDS